MSVLDTTKATSIQHEFQNLTNVSVLGERLVHDEDEELFLECTMDDWTFYMKVSRKPYPSQNMLKLADLLVSIGIDELDSEVIDTHITVQETIWRDDTLYCSFDDTTYKFPLKNSISEPESVHDWVIPRLNSVITEQEINRIIPHNGIESEIASVTSDTDTLYASAVVDKFTFHFEIPIEPGTQRWDMLVNDIGEGYVETLEKQPIRILNTRSVRFGPTSFDTICESTDGYVHLVPQRDESKPFIGKIKQVLQGVFQEIHP